MDQYDLQLELKKALLEEINNESVEKLSTQKNKNLKIKNTDKILSSLSNTRELRFVKVIREIQRVLKGGLPPKIYNLILSVSYYSSRPQGKLIIKVLHPVAQTELNHKKKDVIYLLKNFSKANYFENLVEVSILREDKINKFSKAFDKEFYEQYHPEAIKRSEQEKTMNKLYFYEEKSFAAYENLITDDKLHNKFEQMRNFIKNNRKMDEERDDYKRS